MVPLYSTEYLNDSNNYVQMTISDQLFLEVLLIEIRGKTISYASFKKKSKNIKEEELQKEIKILEESVNLDLIEIESKKAELENLRKEKLQGVLVRSRMKWAQEGEKPTKYFCSLESRNYINKTILNITKDSGITLNKQDEI